MDKDSLKKYINTIGEHYRYITPKEFDDIILNRSADPLCKSLFVLLYLGVKGNGFIDLCNIREDDIDLESGMVIGENKVLCVIPEQYRCYFKDTMNAENYVRYDNDGKILNTSKINKDTEYFIKRRVGKSKDGTANPDAALVSTTLMDIQKSIKNPYLTGVSLYLSGEAYRLIERCNMQMPTNQDLKDFREETGSTLSFVSMKTICGILFEKLGIKTP